MFFMNHQITKASSRGSTFQNCISLMFCSDFEVEDLFGMFKLISTDSPLHFCLLS